MTLRPAAAVLALLFVVACDAAGREDFDQLSQDPALLVGTWEWERDSYYWSGSRESATPESTGETETLVFDADGSLVVLRNGAVEAETTYEVRPPAPGADPILYAGTYGEFVFGTRGRTLVMYVHGLGDGPERVFRRSV